MRRREVVLLCEIQVFTFLPPAALTIAEGQGGDDCAPGLHEQDDLWMGLAKLGS